MMDSKVFQKRLQKQQHDFYKRYSIEPHRKHCQWKRYMLGELRRLKGEVALSLREYVSKMKVSEEDSSWQTRIFHQAMQECRRTRFVDSFRSSMASIIEGSGEQQERRYSRGNTLPSLGQSQRAEKKDRFSERPMTREQLLTISSRFSVSGKGRGHEINDEHVRNVISRKIKEQLEEVTHPLHIVVRLFARLFTQKHIHFASFYYPTDKKEIKDFQIIEEEEEELLLQTTEARNTTPTKINATAQHSLLQESSRKTDLSYCGIRLSSHQALNGLEDLEVMRSVENSPVLLQKVEEMCRELQDFILFLSNAVVKFYNLVFRLDVLSGLGNQIITYIVELVMKGPTYRLFYGAMRLRDIELEMKLRAKFQKLQNIKPQDVGISPLFSLDYTSDLLNPKYHSPQLNEFEAQARVSEQPYLDAIMRFELLQEMENPFDKLCVITQLTTQIVRCINQFWKGARLKKSSLLIDADQNISIIVFIIIKSKLADLYTQIRIIKRLIPKALRSSTKAGYYLATLEGCLQYVQSLNVNRYVTGEESDLVSQIRTYSHKDHIVNENEFFTAMTHEVKPETYVEEEEEGWVEEPQEQQSPFKVGEKEEGQYFFDE